MATQTFTGAEGKVGAYGRDGRGFFKRREAVLATDVLLTNGVVSGAGDINQMIDVYDDDVVLFVCVEVLTAEGGTMTLDVGDGGDPDKYLDGVNGDAAAGVSYVSEFTPGALSTTNANIVHAGSTIGLAALVGGAKYAATDTIDLITVNAADAGVWSITAAIIAMKSIQTVGNLKTA